MPVVKIVGNGFEKFTGHLGEVEFKDGVSVESISNAEARRLGAFLVIEEHKEGGKQLGYAQDIVDQKTVTFEQTVEGNYKSLQRRQAQQESDLEAEKEEVLDKVVATPQFDFTRESLEAVADEKGLAGLREIASGYAVRGASIQSIISTLMALKGRHGAAEVADEDIEDDDPNDTEGNDSEGGNSDKTGGE